MYIKSLELNKAIGTKEGIANQYANLGTLYMIKGDLTQARVSYEKSLKLYKTLHSPSYDMVYSKLILLKKIMH